MKRLMSSALALIMVLLVFLTGCGGNKNVSDKTSGDGTTANKDSRISEKGVFPIVKEKVNLTVMRPDTPSVSDFEDNELTKYLEAKTNVHIIWNMVPNKDVKTKVNIILASNSDLPDIFMQCTDAITPSTLVNYGSQKIFRSLNDLIEKNSVDFKKTAETVSGLMNIVTAPDGNIYSLPKITDATNNTLAKAMWINKTFLDNLGLQMPKTTDELYTVLKAFKEKDPNKNGKADEIPLVGATNGWHPAVDGFLMMPFIYNTVDTKGGTEDLRFFIKNGKVDVAFNKPEWKKGLTYMKKLTAEKLLDPVSFTQDQNQLKALVEKSDAMVVGAVTSGGYSNFANANGERFKNYVAVPALKGPDGVQQAWYDPYTGIMNGMFVITSACKEPDIAMKWGDIFFSEDVSIRSRLGVPDKDWVKPPEGSKGISGKPALYKTVLVWGSVQKSHWSFSNPGYFSKAWFEGGAVDAVNNPWQTEYFFTKSMLECYDPYKPKETLPQVMMTPEEASEFAQIAAVVNPFIKESVARFALGDRDLDKGWDSYLKDLDNMNVKKLVELEQKAYDRQWKKK